MSSWLTLALLGAPALAACGGQSREDVGAQGGSAGAPGGSGGAPGGSGGATGGSGACGPAPGGMDCIGCSGELELPSCVGGGWVCDADCGPCGIMMTSCVDPCTNKSYEPTCEGTSWVCAGVSACVSPPIWSVAFDKAMPEDIAVDSQGNILVVGELLDATSLGGPKLSHVGDLDVFVAKFDAKGQHVWSKSLGSTGKDFGERIAVDATGRVLVVTRILGTASFDGVTFDPFAGGALVTLMLDSTGKLVFAKQVGAEHVAFDSSGSFVLAGALGAPLDLGGSSPLKPPGASLDFYVAKFDAGGKHLWSRGFGGSSYDYVRDLDLDSSGGVLVTGMYREQPDYGAGALPNGGDYDAFVNRLDAQGNLVFSKGFGGAGRDRGTAVVANAAGGAQLAGVFFGQVSFGGKSLSAESDPDGFLLDLSPTGAVDAGQPIQGVDDDMADYDAWELARLPGGDLLAGGSFIGKVGLGGLVAVGSGGQYDAAVARIGPTGKATWLRRYGGTLAEATEVLTGVAAAPSGHPIIAGNYSGNLDMGNGALGPGSWRMFLAMLAP